MGNLDILKRIEAHLIEKKEIDSLGHRIVYDTKTGWSKNIYGVKCDPSKLDKNGYQNRL